MGLQKLILVDIDSILRLMTHYSDGVVPLDAEAREFSASKLLPRWLCLHVESHEWQNSKPLHVRYEGGKCMRFDEKSGDDPRWSQMNEAPKRM